MSIKNSLSLWQEEALQALEAMGLTDRGRNLASLKECDNNVEAAIDLLFSSA